MAGYYLCKNGIRFMEFSGRNSDDPKDLETCILAPLWLERHLNAKDIIQTPDEAALIVFSWETITIRDRDYLKIHCV